jgi:hypothetical protein
MAQLGVIWADGIWNTAIWNADIWAQSAAPDVTAPTLVSATLAENGTSLSLEFDEAVSAGVGGGDDFTITPSGAAATLSYASGDGTSTRVYTASRALSSTETALLGYVQPGNGIQDAAGNDLASFSGVAITNNANASPTSITISRNWCLAATGANAVLGTLGAADPDVGDTHTFTLVAGTGDTNNASFNIDAGQLRANDSTALGAGSYSVRVQADDSASTPFAQALSVFVYTSAPSSTSDLNRSARGIVTVVVSKPVRG